MVQMSEAYPQVKALTTIHGIGLYSALLIVAELGEVERFRTAKQVGAYAGLPPISPFLISPGGNSPPLVVPAAVLFSADS